MTLKYKGYIGSVEVDTDENILFGKLLHMRDLVNYEAETPAKLRIAFQEAVDDYLEDCADRGAEPDTPFKGQFNIRIDPTLHRELSVTAKSQRKTLNDYVEFILSRHLSVATNKETHSFKGQFKVSQVAGRTRFYSIKEAPLEARYQNSSENVVVWTQNLGSKKHAH